MEMKKESALLNAKMQFVPSQTTIFLDNAKTPISYSKLISADFDHPKYLSSFLRASHIGFTYWGEFTRKP